MSSDNLLYATIWEKKSFNLMNASYKKDINLLSKQARKICQETSNALNAIKWKWNSFLDWEMVVYPKEHFIFNATKECKDIFWFFQWNEAHIVII